MSPRDALIAALEANDLPAVRRLGWADVWEAAATWWAPRQKCTAGEFLPFAKCVGDEDPDRVLDAFRALAGEWRPSPAQVRGWLHRADGEPCVDVGRGTDPAASESALGAVAAAIRSGERECRCEFHRCEWRIDRHAVLRCRECGGIEPGQAYAVEDAGLVAPTPVIETSAVDVANVVPFRRAAA